jgi:4-hydroxybenzoate polyprenyltransferase
MTEQKASRSVGSQNRRLAALFVALRSKQWAKNGLLFAGLLFTLNERHPPSNFGRATLAFVLFCLLSGCAYLINDLRDIEADRLHPKKRERPLASGSLSPSVAIGFVAVVTPAVLAASYILLGPALFLVALVYFAQTLAYSFWLKNIVLIDVLTVSFGFVLRAVAGSVALPVRASEWLLLCTFLLALFLALMKRRAELTALGSATTTRPILAEYSVGYLDQMITLTATTVLVSYLLYTVLSPTGRAHPYLMATAPFVLYGLFRYLYLAHRRGMGEAPEVVLLEDRPMIINLVVWVSAVVAAMLI